MSILRSLPRTLPRVATPAIRSYASAASPSISVTSTRSNASAPALANIEASWKSLPAEEQFEVYQQLEELQKRDWKELSVDEKKAAYFVAFGPHGPRAPTMPEGNTQKVFLYTAAAVAAAFGLFTFARSRAKGPAPTVTREYQEQMTEYMRSQNQNPISGVSSEGYKGKGMVTL
ncbi:cytochrome c oxidase subunit V [Dioszegia hungarica]|uniref:Cytochrome c oxidase subunit V n=1 Tax=Dioszegia hungarica TaxID=4972 RepID=A0AA38H9D5_9TREE|nr:cytochrome c oxidase subunit V [Dioszegia hungarica]KAI9636050.1 cytochrome c oxidase subunit V [Dioszegia hungarica]